MRQGKQSLECSRHLLGRWSEAKEGVAQGQEYQHQDNWGEHHDKTSNTCLVVLTVADKSFRMLNTPVRASAPQLALPLSPCDGLLACRPCCPLLLQADMQACMQADLTPAQPTFLNPATVLFAGFDHGPGRRLGIHYCPNRASRCVRERSLLESPDFPQVLHPSISRAVARLYTLPWQTVDAVSTPMTATDLHVRSPTVPNSADNADAGGLTLSFGLQVSPSGKHVVWLENGVGGPHAQASRVMMADADKLTQSQVLIPIHSMSVSFAPA